MKWGGSSQTEVTGMIIIRGIQSAGKDFISL